jgi:sigma-E factor negative regulatory protein RseC
VPTEKGVVIKVKGEHAWIKTEKSNTCEGCASRDSCGNPGGGKEMEVEAVNIAGAGAGDLVLISFASAPLIKVYTLVYIFPILALLVGAILGQHLSGWLTIDESLAALILGFLFFAGAFFIIKACSGRMARKGDYRPKVLRILSAAKCPPESIL